MDGASERMRTAHYHKDTSLGVAAGTALPATYMEGDGLEEDG